MRWFGPEDPVSLGDIRQAGCEGVVSALHQLPVGAVWSREAIALRKSQIEAGNDRYSPLHWVVVESLPVHEAIKQGKAERDELIANYIQSLRNLASEGIFTVCYNFMPVLDWSRTNVAYPLASGATTLRFDWKDFAVFDLFLLKRPEALHEYPDAVQEELRLRYDQMTPDAVAQLTSTVLLGLPGSKEAFDLDTFQSLLDPYREIDESRFRENLYYFIRQVAPEAQALGINWCIHPDDPPRSLLGLPRVVSTEADLAAILEACDVPANGITFCTGSLGVRAENDLPEMVRKFASRIHFIHLRATQREKDPLNFQEAEHLQGDVPMYEVVKALVLEEERRHSSAARNARIPMRPDHGFLLLDDLNKTTYPGYSAIGRLKGLAELRGLEMGIRKFLNR